MLVLILLTDIDPHLLQEESKTCPRDSRAKELTAKQNKQLAELECNDMGTILFMIAIAAITLGFFFWTDKRESQTK